jgi:SAM-dependent methyltransferase
MSEDPRAAEQYDQHGVAEFFRLHVQLYGADWRALGWQSHQTQYRRFAVLAEVAPLSQQRILDVGCGLGDLYGYLRSQGIAMHYTGYDLLPEMLAHARRRYPEASFAVRDILQGLGDECFDYILSSGAFNVNFGNNLSAVQWVVRELFDHCTHGVAINFLSTTDRQRDRMLFHYHPPDMQAYCQTFCPHVQLREDYLPNDFTLYLYHQPHTASGTSAT